MHTPSNQFRMAESISRRSTDLSYISTEAPRAEYSAGLKLAIERGWLEMHDSGTYVKFTPAGADLFA